MRFPRVRLAWLLFLFAAGAAIEPAPAQVARAANQEYLTPEGRRAAAFEMTHANRPGLEESERLVKSFEINSGSHVADVGAGVGYMLPLLVAAVGSEGRVFAEDIQPDFVAAIGKKIEVNGWPNVTAVLGTPVDPKLPHNRLDVALLIDVYHHLDYPGEIINRIRDALKPHGRLIVADFYNSRPHPRSAPEVLRRHIRADRDDFAGEIAVEGFRLVKKFDHLPHEYVLVFKKEESEEETLQ